MATGYLNIQKSFRTIFNENGMPPLSIVTSSPRANSFYRGGYFKEVIPALYRLNAIELLEGNSKQGNVNVYEFTHGNWTFHAKGFWLFEKNDTVELDFDDGIKNESLPSMTIIGSSNFNHRSNFLDNEA